MLCPCELLISCLKMAAQNHNTAQVPSADIVGDEFHNEEPFAEIETLKNTIRMLNLEHKVEILEILGKVIQEKEIQDIAN